MSIDEKGFNYPNLPRDELEALHQLSQDDSIVIKPADKGSAIVVWGREGYCKEAYMQLNDSGVYQKVNSYSGKIINNIINQQLAHMLTQKEINKRQLTHLSTIRAEPGKFYLLPKIHKRLHQVPGRPIISNCGMATENISAFVEYHLSSIIPAIPRILKDTMDFLNRLTNINPIPENAFLVTFDVVGLYPHIPHQEGISAMRHYLDNNIYSCKKCDSIGA